MIRARPIRKSWNIGKSTEDGFKTKKVTACNNNVGTVFKVIDPCYFTLPT